MAKRPTAQELIAEIVATGVLEEPNQTPPEEIKIPNTKVQGKKRRAWIIDEDDHDLYKPKPNLSQTQAKPKPNSSQTQAKPKPKPKPNLSQIFKVNRLSDLQKNVLLIIYENCQLNLGYQTEELKISYFEERIKFNKKSAIIKAIQRLTDIKAIIRIEWKPGRGGWTIYEISKESSAQISKYCMSKFETNLSQTQAKPKPQPEPNLSSSSFKDLKDTTRWTIDISPYRHLLFTDDRFKQAQGFNTLTEEEAFQTLDNIKYCLDNRCHLQDLDKEPIYFIMSRFSRGKVYECTDRAKKALKMDEEILTTMRKKTETANKIKYAMWHEKLAVEEKNRLRQEMPHRLWVSLDTVGITAQDIYEWLIVTKPEVASTT